MCYCTIFFTCGHTDKDAKPYHCKCDSTRLEDKKFARRCDDCGDIMPDDSGTRDQGRVFANENLSEMRARLAKLQDVLQEEDKKVEWLEVDKESRASNEKTKASSKDLERSGEPRNGKI